MEVRAKPRSSEHGFVQLVMPHTYLYNNQRASFSFHHHHQRRFVFSSVNNTGCFEAVLLLQSRWPAVLDSSTTPVNKNNYCGLYSSHTFQRDRLLWKFTLVNVISSPRKFRLQVNGPSYYGHFLYPNQRGQLL